MNAVGPAGCVCVCVVGVSVPVCVCACVWVHGICYSCNMCNVAAGDYVGAMSLCPRRQSQVQWPLPSDICSSSCSAKPTSPHTHPLPHTDMHIWHTLRAVCALHFSVCVSVCECVLVSVCPAGSSSSTCCHHRPLTDGRTFSTLAHAAQREIILIRAPHPPPSPPPALFISFQHLFHPLAALWKDIFHSSAFVASMVHTYIHSIFYIMNILLSTYLKFPFIAKLRLNSYVNGANRKSWKRPVFISV